MRRLARRAGALGPRTGAITFMQRFGGALNLNVHFHCIIPDGVFVREKGKLRFLALAPPLDEDVAAVLPRMVLRFEQLLRPWLASEEDEASPPDALSVAQVEALNSLGTVSQDSCKARRLAAYLDGFSLHAGVHLHANDRKGLARLCGYGARPPLSQERLSQLPDGRIAYQLKRPLGDGRQLLLMRPTELLRRLATLVPPPRAHLVRYHGVFGPASGWRRQVIPLCSESSKTALPCAFPPQRTEDIAAAATEATFLPLSRLGREGQAAISCRALGQVSWLSDRSRAPPAPTPVGTPHLPSSQ